MLSRTSIPHWYLQLLWLDGDLHSISTIHLVQRLLIFGNFEHVSDLRDNRQICQFAPDGSLLTMPLTLIFPLSRYATARGKQCVCANDPMIYKEDQQSANDATH